MRLEQLAAVSGPVALCGVGVEVDAFLRSAPPLLGSVAWASLVVVDQRPLETARLEQLGDTFACPVHQERHLPDDVAAVVRSPGFPVEPEVAARVPTTNPAALWLAERASAAGAGRTVGVTGTKGKSSVVTLLADELGRRGRDVFLGGNVGTALWERTPDDPVLTVAEISSYQAIELEHSPDLAALTLLDVDHLDLHGTVARYHQAKLNVLCGAERAAEAAVVPAADEGLVRERCGSLPLRLVPADADVRRSNARVVGELLVLLGEEEAADDALVDHLVAEYPVLAGRFHQLDRPGDAVRWVDDALASNVAALVAGLRRADGEHEGRRLVLIAGGRDDRGSATDAAVRAVADVRPTLVLCLDEMGARLAADLRAGALPPDVEVREVASLEDAVVAARACAEQAPTTVLFSPGAPTPRDQGTWKDRSARFAGATSASHDPS